MKSLLTEFKDFLNRGNFIDFAVAFVIAGAVTLVIESIVAGLITPLIAAIFGQPNLNSVGNFTINDAQFSIGLILTAVVNFVAVAAVIFALLKAYNKAARREGPAALAKPPQAVANDLLTEIRDLLASQQPPAPPQG